MLLIRNTNNTKLKLPNAMFRPTVFIIGGYSRVGKDTLADRIAVLTGAKKLSFADKLKAAGNCFFTSLGIESVNLTEDSDKVKFRELLVAMARAARTVEVDIFARHAAEIARYNILMGRSVVIPDWRYLNELEVLHRVAAPAKIVSVLMHRIGSHPANIEESNSIEDIERSSYLDKTRSFSSGDLDGIDEFAHQLVADNCTQVPGA